MKNWLGEWPNGACLSRAQPAPRQLGLLAARAQLWTPRVTAAVRRPTNHTQLPPPRCSCPGTRSGQAVAETHVVTTRSNSVTSLRQDWREEWRQHTARPFARTQVSLRTYMPCYTCAGLAWEDCAVPKRAPASTQYPHPHPTAMPRSHPLLGPPSPRTSQGPEPRFGRGTCACAHPAFSTRPDPTAPPPPAPHRVPDPVLAVVHVHAQGAAQLGLRLLQPLPHQRHGAHHERRPAPRAGAARSAVGPKRAALQANVCFVAAHRVQCVSPLGGAALRCAACICIWAAALEQSPADVSSTGSRLRV